LPGLSVTLPFFGNIRWAWEQPLFARFFEQLASFSRLTLLDKRGSAVQGSRHLLGQASTLAEATHLLREVTTWV